MKFQCVAHFQTGADLGFSRGGGGGRIFKKNFETFDDFFLGRPN